MDPNMKTVGGKDLCAARDIKCNGSISNDKNQKKRTTFQIIFKPEEIITIPIATYRCKTV
jgi:hypothetical protein